MLHKVRIFLDDFGIFLGRKRNRFIVKKGDKKAEFVADEVDSIVLTSQGIAISANALSLAVKNNIPVIFARYRGWPYAIVQPTTMTGSVRARREQFAAYNDERGSILAKGFVDGKLLNQSNLLKLMAKNRKETDPMLAEKLYEGGREIGEITMKVNAIPLAKIDDIRQTLMNLEADGARIYWDCVKEVLPPELGFSGRETRGARDPFNAMLNFGYQAVLFPEVWKAVVYAGLDPYAGYLHADRPGKPSLVLDLMEEFRQHVVDRTIIGLISKGSIKPGEILATNKSEGRVLSKSTTETLLEGLQERLDSPVFFEGRRIPLKNVIISQARKIVHLLLGETKSYTPFSIGW